MRNRDHYTTKGRCEGKQCLGKLLRSWWAGGGDPPRRALRRRRTEPQCDGRLCDSTLLLRRLLRDTLSNHLTGVEVHELVTAAEPVEHLVSLHPGRPPGQDRLG